ncbi:MAG: hypothetical protein DRJ05_01210 [Bacteroidetes bacterium]|nr:MAG: hypothetical protein DRJ05_01210 [Bacteroidota bacterium]
MREFTKLASALMILLISSAFAMGQFDPPSNLTASVSSDDVSLNWLPPGGGGGADPQWIQWDDGSNSENGIGLTAGGTFYCASHWMPADLFDFNGMSVTQLTFFPYSDPAATYVLKIWTGANAANEVFSMDVTSFTVDEFNTFDVTPIVIDATMEHWFGYVVTHGEGTNPAGIDAGPAVQELGDMISFDGAAWTGMSAAYGLDFNWNIAVYVDDLKNAAPAQTLVKSTYPVSNGTFVESGATGEITTFNPGSTKELTGYNIYRDGVVVGNTSETSYSDMDLAAGTYEYCVTAVYDDGESDCSNTVEAIIEDNSFASFEDDFDSYNAGEQLACQNPDDWTTWSEDPCNANEDPYITTDFASSAPNAVVVEGTNDCVHVFPNYTEGVYAISFDMYIPAGFDGYFNTLADFAGGGSTWGMQVYFYAAGGLVDAGGAGTANFNVTYDAWFHNEVIVDLNNDWATYTLDGEELVGWVWSTGAFGTGNLNQLGGNNFYAGFETQDPKYYFDNYLVTEYVDPPACENFDALTVGGLVAEQLGLPWTTWGGTNADDATVSDTYSNSPGNSFVVDAGTVDLILELDEEPISTGTAVYSHYMYVPSGFSGYFNVQSEPTPGEDWVCEIFLNDDGSAYVMENTNQTDFTYTMDTWVFVEVDFDMGTGMAQVWVDGTMIVEWNNPFTIGGIDYYGADTGGTPMGYFDDVCFAWEGPPPGPTPPPENLTGPDVVVVGSDIDLTWDAPSAGGWINWDDGENAGNGIGLTAGGTFYTASHWTAAEMAQYIGLSVSKISFFPYGDPGATFKLKVWSGANAANEELSQDITFEADVWNEVDLTSPVVIAASTEYWFGYEVTHAEGTNPAGVDAGPAVQGSGDMISFDAVAWVSMGSEYGLDFNWNIQAFVGMGDKGSVSPISKPTPVINNPAGNLTSAIENGTATGVKSPFVPQESKELLSYNVMRNGSQIGNTTETNYTDESVSPVGLYTYCVTAVYDNGESECSNDHIVDVITGINENLFNNTQVFPNPASDMVSVKSDIQISNVKVYNNTGQIISNEQVDTKLYQLNTTQFESGMYFFQIETTEGVISKRIIIQ